MKPTLKQEEAIRVAKSRFLNNEPYTCIAGVAGSGKSATIAFLVAELELLKNEIIYTTFTGKAALVLREKGLPAITLHKLLYDYRIRENTFEAKVTLDKEYENCKIIIVDEISMVPQYMWEKLLSHGIHIIACGDGFQLPSISTQNTVLNRPHVTLTEVMRQALDSEIIYWANEIREGRQLRPFNGKDVTIIKQKDLDTSLFEWADQILVGTNSLREKVNGLMRVSRGYFGLLTKGEKVVCTKNYWEKINGRDMPLINGLTGNVYNISEKNDYFECDFYPFGEVEFANQFKVRISRRAIEGEELNRYSSLNQFEYGYAITVHKAQGSEWDNVLLFDDSKAMGGQR